MVDSGLYTYLTEVEWFDLLCKLREKVVNFQADYILSQKQISFMHENREIFPDVLRELIDKVYNEKLYMVELPIDED